MTARPRLLTLDRQVVWRAFSRACAKTGKRMAAKIAMIAITTSSSISVKPLRSIRGPGDIRRLLPRDRPNSGAVSVGDPCQGVPSVNVAYCHTDFLLDKLPGFQQ